MKQTRDDFAKLDDVSFDLCLKILENYEKTREFFTRWMEALGKDAAKNPSVYDAIAFGYQSRRKTQDAKIKLSILEQMKEENCGGRA